MPQSLAQILVHIVFSTKNRERILASEIRDELHAYIGGIVGNLSGSLLRAGSVDDHIHLLVAHPRTCSPAALIEAVKTGSSKWIKTKGSRYAGFQWQAGYGMFSLSPGHRTALERYIDSQEEHHRTVSFPDEYRELCAKYGVVIDERYVWD